MNTIESLNSNICFYRNKISQFLDNAVEFSKCGLCESARLYFDMALTYKIELMELEKELNKLEKDLKK